MTQQNPLTIIHLVRSPIGGIFRHLADLAVAQAEQGHRVGIICDEVTGGPFEATHIERLRPLLPLGVRRLRMPRAVGPSDIAAFLRVKKVLQSVKPDIVHCHGSKGGVYGRFAKGLGKFGGLEKGTAVFYAPHGGSLHYPKSSKEGRIYFTMERFLERWTSGLIHVSAYEQRTYVEKVGVPKTMATVVHNGITSAELVHVEPDESARDFLFIGMLRDLKGVDLFIDAMAQLNRESLTTAWIVGDGAEADKARYRDMVAQRGLEDAVAFRPSTPARKAFAMAKAIVVPSRAESLPYIVLEAAGAAMPMICTQVGGVGEIYGDRSAALVNPDLPDITNAMRVMKQADFKSADTDYLHQRVSDEFSIKVMEQRVMDLYRSALQS
ncbi:glycosyltransferase family 4 protein [Pararhizobium sp. IMCC21322]|uniref:glycosyltransferase family 4 protein n=1 Tax=Pararhizobium sp. IMCC21322 TaxID=3067903 RepID=UPI00274280CB|nr:glycosyltransferase family 4 protein [Pararhizobium sp. IMCC21322]